MCVVIVGGNERMEQQYKVICRDFGYRAKVFTKMPADFKRQIGCPDLLVLFTGTVSHKMVACAAEEARRKQVRIARCHTSSCCALRDLLQAHCGRCGSCPCGQTCPQGEAKDGRAKASTEVS